MRGHGAVMETLPLCPGYQGMDTRMSFIDEQNDTIYAVDATTTSGMESTDEVRVFEAYVRVFSGEIGCPGSLQVQTFPYLEIISVK